MRKYLFVIILLMAVLQGYAQSKQEQQLIQAPLLKFFDAMSAQQPDAIKAVVTQDFTLFENGKVWNTDSVTFSMGRYKGLDVKRMNKLDFLKTERINNISLVSYYNTADMTYNGKRLVMKWLESAVLLREKQAWRIKVLHSTEIRPESLKRN